MRAAPLPFRLLSPAEYAQLSAEDKTDYLVRLTDDIHKHLRLLREENRRRRHWLLHKDDPDRR